MDDRTKIPVDRNFLIHVDYICSLIGYRHSKGIPDDLVQDLRDTSLKARKLYDPKG